MYVATILLNCLSIIGNGQATMDEHVAGEQAQISDPVETVYSPADSMDGSSLRIEPAPSVRIDTVQRTRCMVMVAQINTMQLECDTLLISDLVCGQNVEMIYFDSSNRLRKYAVHTTAFCEEDDFSTYYNTAGELIYVANNENDRWHVLQAYYYLNRGYLVDFYVNLGMVMQDDGGGTRSARDIKPEDLDFKPAVGAPLTRFFQADSQSTQRYLRTESLICALKQELDQIDDCLKPYTQLHRSAAIKDAGL